MKLEARIQARRGPDFELDLNLSLTAPVTAIYGPSGSGKTTLLECLAGLQQPQSGMIRLNGRTLYSSDPLLSLPAERRLMGYVAQEGLLFPHLTVHDNVLYGYRLRSRQGYRLPDPDAVCQALDLLPLLERRPATLSGGERQRVALGRALLAGPELLLLDEPLASVDPPRKARILDFVGRALRRFQTPALYVSHDASEVVAVADALVLLREGRVVAEGPVDALLASPAFVAQSEGRIGALVEGRVAATAAEPGLVPVLVGQARLLAASAALESGQRVLASIDCEDVLLLPSGSGPQGASNHLEVEVVSLAVSGPRALVSLDAGFRLLASVTPAAIESMGVGPGHKLTAVFKATAVRLNPLEH